jgi:hypothetical protein
VIVRIGHYVAEPPDVQIVFKPQFELPFLDDDSIKRAAPIWQVVIILWWRLISLTPYEKRAELKEECRRRNIESEPDRPTAYIEFHKREP